MPTNKSDEKSVNENFPTLYNLSKVESDSLITLLSSPDGKYTEAIRYANTLKKDDPLEDISSTINTKKILSTNNVVSNIESVDETESTTTASVNSWYQPQVQYDGEELDYYSEASPWYAIEFPKFTTVHKRTVSLQGRNTVINVEVPIEYTLAFDQFSNQAYYKIKTDYVAKKPKMYLTGVLGQLHTEYETLSFSTYSGVPGEYAGSADIKIRENRDLVFTTDGKRGISIEVGKFSVGGTFSNGQTISQVRTVQGFFDYHSDILFFGANTGYQGGLGNYTLQVEQHQFNRLQLLKPIVGTEDDLSFTGINQN